MFRKTLAVFLVFMMVFSFIPTGYIDAADTSSETTLIVHYKRSNSDYDNWSLWAWADGKDGKEYKFDYEDSYGKVSVIKIRDKVEKIGFIVKKGEWEEKDIEADRFADIKDGKAEIWLTQGQEEVVKTAPQGAAAFDTDSIKKEEDTSQGSLKVKIHYYRFDEDYSGWNLWLWSENQDGAAYDFNGEDDFGVYFEGEIKDDTAAKLGLILRLNEWEAKDIDIDRFADTDKLNNGVLEIFLIQDDSSIYYDKSKADISPRFLSASAKDEKTIIVSASSAFDFNDNKLKDTFIIKDSDNNIIKISEVKKADNEKTAELILQDEIDFSKSYTIFKEGLKEIVLTVVSAYDSQAFNDKYYYDKDDLGVVYSNEFSEFRLWAPTANSVKLNLYKNGTDGNAYETFDMEKSEAGTWYKKVSGDLNKVYYTYSVEVGGKVNEVIDPYAKAAGVNGNRGMVIDLSTTNPDGWEESSRPEFGNINDAIIYETHIRDFSNGNDSGMVNNGKYLAFTEENTKNSDGMSTGLQHLIDLGVTHVHLLPSFDYATVDESKLDTAQFNWGYDPQNYNVPEGSYSTDPYNGEVRINEYKQMVKSLHDNGIRVVMDVVYNHTSKSADSNFNLIVPNYYYRFNDNGTFSNGSGCGNEVASERLMVRKFIVDSVVYWAKEYKIDGFRFDLMGLHDIETMNEIREALNEIDPSIIIYGEGWDAGGSKLSSNDAALKANTSKLDNIAAFSDDIRDAIKGHVFNSKETGFVSGAEDCVESLIFGLTGSTKTELADFAKVKYSNTGWAGSPLQAINYAEAHDNLTLWDKLATSNPDDSEQDRAKMDKLAASIIFTAQGTPFIQLGQDFLRTKEKEDGSFDENSYKSSDSINNIDWARKSQYKDIYEYYKGLIALRKSNNAFRLTTTDEIKSRVSFIKDLGNQALGYKISGDGEQADTLVYYNASREEVSITLPEGEWNVYANGEKAGTEIIESISGSTSVSPISSLILMKKDANEQTAENDEGKEKNNFLWPVVTAVGIAVIGAVGGSIYFMKKKRKS